MIHHVTVRPATLPQRAGCQVCRWGEYREVGALWKKDLVTAPDRVPFSVEQSCLVSRLLIKLQNNLECLALLVPRLRQMSPDSKDADSLEPIAFKLLHPTRSAPASRPVRTLSNGEAPLATGTTADDWLACFEAGRAELPSFRGRTRTSCTYPRVGR